MNTNRSDEINVLKLSLHGHLVEYLAGFLNGRNMFTFADEFKKDSGRPTFSLITHPSFPHSETLMADTTCQRVMLWETGLSKRRLPNIKMYRLTNTLP